jgi:hypothetical protein
MNFLYLTLLFGICIIPILTRESQNSKKQKGFLKAITSKPKHSKKAIQNIQTKNEHPKVSHRKRILTKQPHKSEKHKIRTKEPRKNPLQTKQNPTGKELGRMNRNKREDFSFLKEIPEKMIHENDIVDFYFGNRIETATLGYDWYYEYYDTETEIYELIDDYDTYTEPHNSFISIPQSVQDTACISSRDCDSNAQCLNYFCFCKENFFGSGKKCCRKLV